MVLSICGNQQSVLATRRCNLWMRLARGARLRNYLPTHSSIHMCILLYICGLFNDAVSTDFIVLIGTVIHEWRICNNVERSGQGQNSRDERKKTTRNLSQDGWWTGRDVNWGICWTQPMFFTFMWPCIMTNPYNKTTRCTNFSNLFWNETLHVSDSSSVHHQEFFTVHTAMVYVIQVCRQLLRRIRMSSILILLESCLYKPEWYIPLQCVQWKTPDDGHRNCPKDVEFHSKINLRN